HALKRDVVRLASRVLAEDARQGAREADVLDPRQSRLPFIGYLRHEQRPAVRHALDVGGDAERVVGRPKERVLPDDGPGTVARAGDESFAPALALHVLETRRRLA